jgi:RNA polymerase sigma factor (sigma-70 family)
VNTLTDQELLHDYTVSRSDVAFAEIVRRYIDFVYSAALRMIRDAHLAEDVTQGVFMALAVNSSRLSHRPALAGWLHRTTQNIAANTVRSAERRRAREQESVAMNELVSTEPDSVWQEIAPHLDKALGELSDLDRDAVLLRYFQQKSAREIGQTLDMSEEAAQKRVIRAVDRLRKSFASHGVAVGASGLVVAVSANAVQAAPVGLPATISTAVCLAGSAIIQTSTAIAATKVIAMTTIQKTILAATLTAAIGTGIYEARQVARMRGQIQTLQHQQAPFTEELQQMTRERDEASGKLAALRDDHERLRKDLQRLAQVKAAGTGDPTELAAKSWLSRVNALRQRLENLPGAKIPELQFLNENDWLEIANTKLETEADYRRTLAEIRKRAEGYFVKRLQPGLKAYMLANNGQWPPDLAQLRPYFNPPVDDTILERWEIVSKDAFPGREFAGDWVITEKAPVDEAFDHRWTIDGPNSAGVGPYQYQPSEGETLKLALEPALKAYAEANGGKEPVDPSQLQPYLTTPAQRVALERLIQMVTTNDGSTINSSVMRTYSEHP